VYVFLEQIRLSVDESLQDVHLHEQPLVDASDVDQAINSLKLGKSDGNTGLNLDHFKHGCGLLASYLSLLFTALLSVVLFGMSSLANTVIYFPGGRLNVYTDSENYHGILLSSIFGKVFDFIVLHRFSDKLATSLLQFGFKAKSSTSICI